MGTYSLIFKSSAMVNILDKYISVLSLRKISMHSHFLLFSGKTSLAENIPFQRVTWVAASHIPKLRPREIKTSSPVSGVPLWELPLHLHPWCAPGVTREMSGLWPAFTSLEPTPLLANEEPRPDDIKGLAPTHTQADDRTRPGIQYAVLPSRGLSGVIFFFSFKVKVCDFLS